MNTKEIPMAWGLIPGMILLYSYTIIGSNPQTERPRPQSWSGHKRLGNYWRVGSGICCFSLLLTVLL